MAPAWAPCSTRMVSSSAVTAGSVDGRTPSSRTTAAAEALRRRTAGAASTARVRMGRASRAATHSGSPSASCLGTSSPTTSDR